ncbi:hypothetical protein HY570_00110 [Candidatus Micrarchaeota archaeon]|nr:hypothetical protein [Candidatus Micrarchaeota archaeon]
MAERTLEDIAEEAVESGGVLATLYFDVFSNSKENLQSILVDFIGRISQDTGVVYAVGEVLDVVEDDNGYSTSAEVKVVAKDFTSLAGIAIKFSPIGIEVIKPNKITLTAGEIQSILLNIAQTSYEFSQFALRRLLSKDELEKFEQKMKLRAELGKKLLEKKGE